MLINELPDDCLLAIFDHVNNLDDLMNCYKVCIKWSHSIVERTKKVKYLIEHPNNPFICVHDDGEDSDELADDVDDLDDLDDEEEEVSYGYSHDCVHYEGVDSIDGTCLSTLFPNLMIAEISRRFRRKVKCEDIVTFVGNQESLKGIINFSNEPIEAYCGKLEMISGNHITSIAMRNGSSIKQLYFGTNTSEVDLSYFPNLERLHITSNEVPYSYYDGPVLEKLKIVELGCSLLHATDIHYGFQFMDSCPNLQSAHISMISRYWFADKTLKHGCLQDLVIDFFYNDEFNWNDLKRLLEKYPNLKHLALWRQSRITEKHIKKLVHILPNLVLLDVRGCDEVTERAAVYVQNYCERYGRSIKFYFDENRDEIKLDWPQLCTKQEKISPGFDFMKHCFLKYFYMLPHFLIPIDN